MAGNTARSSGARTVPILRPRRGTPARRTPSIAGPGRCRLGREGVGRGSGGGQEGVRRGFIGEV
eukprot:535234-Prorocentrum_minimum.AAC.2